MFTKKTFGDLKQGLADRHDAGVLPNSSATLSYWGRLLNRSKDYCADQLRITKSVSLTTSSGSVALPDDFLVCDNVVDDGDNSWSMISSDSSENAVGMVSWITGNQDDGFVLNTPSDKTFTVYYSFRPEDMVLDADVCIIPDPEAVVARAYAMLRMAETDPLEDADKAFAECDRRIMTIEAQKSSNEGGVAFNLQVNA